MSKKIFQFVFLIILTACGSGNTNCPVQDTWSETPTITTKKIRLLCTQNGKQLEESIRRKFAVHFEIDSVKPNVTTKFKPVENYYMRMTAIVKDSIIIIQGEYGFQGLNGIGQRPQEHTINWKEITLNKPGWETMNAIANLQGARKEYNQ